ncbi:Transcriptional regulator, AraC family [Cronobacter sakazakii 696]|nr:Transcriptional regulator, AraC family [Cronobacter sakazakii 696]
MAFASQCLLQGQGAEQAAVAAGFSSARQFQRARSRAVN